MLRQISKKSSNSSQSLYLLWLAKTKIRAYPYPRHLAILTSTKSHSTLAAIDEGLSLSQTLQSSSVSSELGLRQTNPPDSNPSLNPKSPKTPKSTKPPPEISDQEWEIRTGRATDILQTTLPHFFATGLMSSFDKITGEPQPASAGIHIPVVNALEYKPRYEDLESIYSPKIRLSYTPPTPLPPPFPKTLHIEGKPLYLASAAFIRHTLNTLYSDLRVTLNKVTVNTPKSGPVSTPIGAGAEEEGAQNLSSPRRRNREKSLFIGLRVTGTSRVSGGVGEWEVNSTYTFSPLTGFIHVHTVNSIEPAPHQTVYDALRESLGNVFGYGLPDTPAGPRAGSASASGAGAGAGAACGGKQVVKKNSYDKVAHG